MNFQQRLAKHLQLKLRHDKHYTVPTKYVSRIITYILIRWCNLCGHSAENSAGNCHVTNCKCNKHYDERDLNGTANQYTT